jgi:hypothetical protein
MTAYINNYLDEEGATLPKQVQAKFASIPAPCPMTKQTHPSITPKHRKNTSLNFE